MDNMKPELDTKFFAADDAQETLQAIRSGAVDAFVVEEAEGHRVYALETADLPYSALVEQMQQGAAMVDASGDIVYCNPSLALLLDMGREAVIGLPFQDFIDPSHHLLYQNLRREAQLGSSEGEMLLRGANGALISAKFAFRSLSKDKSTTGVLITDMTAQKEQEKLASRLQEMQDEERRRIARELHDSVGQLLVAMGMNLAVVQSEAHKLSPEAAKRISENAVMLDEVNSEIRTISHLLHPPLLDEIGLSSALHWYSEGFGRRSKIKTILDLPENLQRLPQEMEIAIFRAVQECLTNVHRHSGSESCSIKITQDLNVMRVEIKDSGRGIPKSRLLNLAASEGVGFRGMRERIRQLGGVLEVKSDESGTTVTATLPIPPANPATSDVA